MWSIDKVRMLPLIECIQKLDALCVCGRNRPCTRSVAVGNRIICIQYRIVVDRVHVVIMVRVIRSDNGACVCWKMNNSIIYALLP